MPGAVRRADPCAEVDDDQERPRALLSVGGVARDGLPGPLEVHPEGLVLAAGG